MWHKRNLDRIANIRHLTNKKSRLFDLTNKKIKQAAFF